MCVIAWEDFLFMTRILDSWVPCYFHGSVLICGFTEQGPSNQNLQSRSSYKVTVRPFTSFWRVDNAFIEILSSSAISKSELSFVGAEGILESDQFWQVGSSWCEALIMTRPHRHRKLSWYACLCMPQSVGATAFINMWLPYVSQSSFFGESGDN